MDDGSHHAPRFLTSRVSCVANHSLGVCQARPAVPGRAGLEPRAHVGFLRPEINTARRANHQAAGHPPAASGTAEEDPFD